MVGPLLKKVWGNPLTKGVDFDDPQAIRLRHRILKSNPLLRAHYEKWYREFLKPCQETKNLGGDVIEIGCGPSFLDEMIPEVIKTDCVPNPFAGKIVDGMNMDFRDESLRAIFLVEVLHHMSHPGRFLAQAQRCLKPGGRLVMLEPNHDNFFMPAMLKCLNHYEYFDDTAEDWVNTCDNRFTNANLSLPWIIFFRDQERFRREFPRLRLRSVSYNTFLSYYVSGGMMFRPFLPKFSVPLVNAFEKACAPLMRFVGSVMVLDIEKTCSSV